jgi:hypothetical protein
VSTNRRLVDIERPEGPVPRLPLILIGVLLIVFVVFLVFGLSRPRQAQPVEIFPITPPSTLDATAAFTNDEVTVYVPPDAIDREGMISIAPGSPNLFQVAQDVWTRTEVVIVEFLDMERRAVRGITFAKPIEICFRLDEEEWQSFTAAPDAYQVQIYAEDKNPAVWEALPIVTYPEQSQVCGQTTHLSIFGLATRLEPGIPVTGPTLTGTPSPALTGTGIVVEPTWTNDRNRRDTPTPTRPAPTRTSVPPTRTPRPPTEPPTDPPPTVYP